MTCDTKFKEYYKEYMDIRYSYCGDNTDWIDCRKKLYRLKENIKYITVSHSPNDSYYNFVKKQLYKEVEEEYQRVDNITKRC